jgi:hypothetical protein
VPPSKLPSYATLRRKPLAVETRSSERFLAEHSHVTLQRSDSPAEAKSLPPLRALAFVGKTLRGTLKGSRMARTDLIGLVRHHPVRVLAQRRVSLHTNEITAVVKPLRGRNLRQTVTTLNALLTQGTVARLVLQQHRDYLMVVTGNQPELWAGIDLLFEQPSWLAQNRGGKRNHPQIGVRASRKSPGRYYPPILLFSKNH